nr:hypothetical protein [Tanacetum cinerariifolium]
QVQMKELVLNQWFSMYQLMSQRKNSLRILLMTKEGGDDEHEFDENKFDEETKDEESFDPIPQIPENSEDEGNGEEDLGLNIGEEERYIEVEEEDELYRDVNINQGRGLQASLEVEDSHVTLTPTPTSVAPLPITTPTMTSSTIATTTTTNQAPILPKTVPSNIIQNLPNFGSLFLFDDRLRTVDENIKKIIKEQVKEQVKAQVSKILPRIEQAVNEQLEAEVLTRSSHSSRTSYAVAADLSEMELKKILIEKMEGNKRRDDDADKDEEPFARPDRGSKRRREGKEHESASALTEIATRSAGRSTQGSRSRQASVSESDFVEEPMQTTSQMEKPSHPEFDTDTLTPELLAGHTYKLMKGSCKSLVELEYHLEEVFKATTDQLDWVNLKGKLTNLTVEERFAFNVSLPMFTRSIVIQRRVEDLQLGVESYQKRLNLTKPDLYRSDLKRKEAYTAYSNPQGFIYQNKDKRNRLMRIDELHKFSDGTLTDVHTTLDDRLKGIRMQYLPQSIWRKSDKDRAAAMIQAINKRLKTRRIMRSLERFVRGRLYEGDF